MGDIATLGQLAPLAAIVWFLTDFIKRRTDKLTPKEIATLAAIALASIYVLFPAVSAVIMAVGSVVLTILGANILQNFSKPDAPNDEPVPVVITGASPTVITNVQPAIIRDEPAP